MIDSKSFRNTKGGKKLKKLAKGVRSAVKAEHADELEDLLYIMDTTGDLEAIKAAGSDYHPWRGRKIDGHTIHSVSLNGPWRLLFCFDKATGYFHHLEYENPHP